MEKISKYKDYSVDLEKFMGGLRETTKKIEKTSSHDPYDDCSDTDEYTYEDYGNSSNVKLIQRCYHWVCPDL